MKARIKITPHKVGDGGILCYPMESNIPVPKDNSWKLVKCPVCGENCWETLLGNTNSKGSNGSRARTPIRLYDVCIERRYINGSLFQMWQENIFWRTL